MLTTQHRQDRARRALVAVLPRAARVGALDRKGRVRLGSKNLGLVWIGEGNLRDARSFLELAESNNTIAVARRMSPGAREALSKAEFGWVDETGAAEIAIGAIMVSRTPTPATHTKPAPRWSPSVLAVAETVLMGTRATVAATCNSTGLSSGSCSRALKSLEDLGLLTASAKRGSSSARSPRDRNHFLDTYAVAAQAQRRGPCVQVGALWQDPLSGLAAIGSQWNRKRLSWAVTGAVASLLLAPHLSSVTSAEVYVDAKTPSELEAFAQRAGLRVIKGGRLTLRPFPTVTTKCAAEIHEDLRVAPWPRVFADLKSVGVRGEKAAEHLRETTCES